MSEGKSDFDIRKISSNELTVKYLEEYEPASGWDYDRALALARHLERFAKMHQDLFVIAINQEKHIRRNMGKRLIVAERLAGLNTVSSKAR